MARTKVHGKLDSPARARRSQSHGKTSLMFLAALAALSLISYDVVPTVVGLALVAPALGTAFWFAIPGTRAHRVVIDEVRTLQYLRSADVEHIVCLETFAPDEGATLVAVGPQLAVVVARYGRGEVSVGADGSLSLKDTRISPDPVAQTLRTAAELRSQTGLVPDAVVCISRMRQDPLRLDTGDGVVWICSAKDLADLVDSLEPRIDPSQSASLASRLADSYASS